MVLPLVTEERVIKELEREGLKYFKDDSDGEIGIGFEDIIIWVNLSEKVMRLYGFWRGTLTTPEDFERAIYLVTDANSDLVAPKQILIRDEKNDQSGRIMLEISQLIAEGMTDAQLSAHIRRSFTLIFRATETLVKEFPHVIDWEMEEEN
ncbi:YbjN domain-containing protein [Actinomycetaceae bacterium TAE3-ERU4]|nr:YbjN domain-containing protein [Actinomycetaceae bacterium TAE3-ERU4]